MPTKSQKRFTQKAEKLLLVIGKKYTWNIPKDNDIDIGIRTSWAPNIGIMCPISAIHNSSHKPGEFISITRYGDADIGLTRREIGRIVQAADIRNHPYRRRLKQLLGI